MKKRINKVYKHRKTNVYKTKFIRLLHSAYKWVVSTFVGTNDRGTEKAFLQLLKRMDHVLHSRGPLGLIAFVKAIRSALLNYLSGTPVKSDIGIGLTTDGIPKVLGDLVPIVRGLASRENYTRESVLPLLNTILFGTRALKVEVEAPTDSITSPASVQVPSFRSETVRF
jgi:hypothetical protein